EHEHPGEQEGAGVDLVLPGVAGRGAVRRLEDAVAGDVVDVPTGSDADPSDLGGQGIGEVVAVQVGGGDDVELVGAGQYLLEGDVGDRVLHEDPLTRITAAVLPRHGHPGELLPYEVVAPTSEGALGELLDVALVHEGDGPTPPVHGVVDGGADEALRARLGDRLDPDARVGSDRPPHLVVQERDEL